MGVVRCRTLPFRGVSTILRIWGWFGDPETLATCVKQYSSTANVSLWMRRQDLAENDVVVVGPQSQEVSPYPFLDVRHHMKRLGIVEPWASRYTEKIAQGAPVVCIETASAPSDDVGQSFIGHDPWIQD